jgi:hypothetical protein
MKFIDPSELPGYEFQGDVHFCFCSTLNPYDGDSSHHVRLCGEPRCDDLESLGRELQRSAEAARSKQRPK